MNGKDRLLFGHIAIFGPMFVVLAEAASAFRVWVVSPPGIRTQLVWGTRLYDQNKSGGSYERQNSLIGC